MAWWSAIALVKATGPNLSTARFLSTFASFVGTDSILWLPHKLVHTTPTAAQDSRIAQQRLPLDGLRGQARSLAGVA